MTHSISCSLAYARKLAGFGIKAISPLIYVCHLEHDENEWFCIPLTSKPVLPNGSHSLPALTIDDCHHIFKKAGIAFLYDSGETTDENVISITFRGAYHLNNQIIRKRRSDTDIICECALHLLKQGIISAEFVNHVLITQYTSDAQERANAAYKLQMVENDLRHIESSIKQLTNLLANATRDLSELR